MRVEHQGEGSRTDGRKMGGPQCLADAMRAEQPGRSAITEACDAQRKVVSDQVEEDDAALKLWQQFRSTKADDLLPGFLGLRLLPPQTTTSSIIPRRKDSREGLPDQTSSPLRRWRRRTTSTSTPYSEAKSPNSAGSVRCATFLLPVRLLPPQQLILLERWYTGRKGIEGLQTEPVRDP